MAGSRLEREKVLLRTLDADLFAIQQAIDRREEGTDARVNRWLAGFSMAAGTLGDAAPRSLFERALLARAIGPRRP